MPSPELPELLDLASISLAKLAPDPVLNFHDQHRGAFDIKCSASLVGHG